MVRILALSATFRAPGHRRLLARRLVALGVLLSLALGLSACGGSSKPSKLPPLRPDVGGPISILNPLTSVYNQPVATMAELRELGVVRVDVPLFWSYMAPDSSSPVTPSVDLTDPAVYSPTWTGPLDLMVRAAKADGIGLQFQLTGPPPRWAEGRGAPHPATQTEWRPSASAFGQFVTAMGTRYDGHYTPPGQASPLPAVRIWSVWNEPNIGANLAPEAVDHGAVENAPRLYRALLNAAWKALHATGHGSNEILIGELAPAGFRTGTLGVFNNMPPLQFLRALYCVDQSYRPLVGTEAAQRGCPTTAAASKRFAAQNPALFNASAFATHLYLFGLPPDEPAPDEPDYAELPEVGNLEHVLDSLNSVYGSHTRFDIYSTEYGYQTHPPDDEPGTKPPTTAAAWINWSEYISWRDWPRLRSYDQYLLIDPATCNPSYRPAGHCDFATGLETWDGVPKPGFYAFRMPIYLPVTSTTAGHPLEVWGCVRPYYYVRHETKQPQVVQIQFVPQGGKRWRTVGQVRLVDRYGYLDVEQRFPGSGDVRLAWSYPSGQQIYSRTVAVSLH